MDLGRPFDPLTSADRRVFGLITALSGVAASSIAVYVLVTSRAVIVVAVAAGCALLSFTIAKRLFTNRTPRVDRRLVSPWLTLAVGLVVFIAAAGNILIDVRSAGIMTFLLCAGAAAAVFGWRQIRRADRQSSPLPPDGA